MLVMDDTAQSQTQTRSKPLGCQRSSVSTKRLNAGNAAENRIAPNANAHSYRRHADGCSIIASSSRPTFKRLFI